MDKFPILNFISAVLKVAGWIIVLIGVGVAVFGGGTFGSVSILIGVVAVAFGLTAAAAGESIGVLFAIEANTRRAAERA